MASTAQYGRSGTDICKINAVKLAGRRSRSCRPSTATRGIFLGHVPLGPKSASPIPTPSSLEFADNYYPQTVSTYRDPDETPNRRRLRGADRQDRRAGHHPELVVLGLLGYLTRSSGRTA